MVQGLLAAPVLALGGSPVLAYNLVLLAGFVLTGTAFCWLTWRWTGSWSAGVLAGSLAAFNAHVLVRMTHLQTQHPEFIAVMLFAVDRLLTSRRFRDAVVLGAAFALQGLTSVYLLVFSTWALMFAVLSRAREWLAAGAAGMRLRLTAAGGVAVLLMAPYLSAYLRLRQRTGWTRAADEQGAASLVDYLATGARLHYDWWSRPFAAETISYTFPGFVALILVAAACAFRENRADARFRMCAAVAIGCAGVSFAPHLPFYPALHQAIPLFQAVRVPAHLGQIVLLMFAVMAGFGLAGVERRWTRTKMWPAVAVVLCLIVNLEALRAPVGWVRFEGVPPVYDALRSEPSAVIVELPFPIPSQWFLNGRYMVNAVVHRRPMLNGYSGFRPASYEASYAGVQQFPADASLIALHGLGVTHVVVHREAFVAGQGLERFEAIAATRSLELIASDGEVFIYALRSP